MITSIFANPISWLGIIFLPCIVAGLFSLRSFRSSLVMLVPWVSLPALLASIVLQSGEGVKVPWIFFQSMFALDATGKVFLFFTSVLWLLAGIYSVSYVNDSAGKARYFVCYLLAMSGNIGLILAQDVFSFYFLFALMSFASYGLVVYEKNPEAVFAGKVYLILVVVGEAFVFSGLLLLVHATGSIYIAESIKLLAVLPECRTVMLFMFLGFGIKAGALPMHVWLPLAHPVAPTPASSVLSGAMIKAGLLGWLRFLPLGAAAFLDWGYAVIILGIFAAIYGALVGLTQKKIKAVLAYSSISQMGMMTVIVGIGLLKPEIWGKCWMVLMVYALHHALAKGALFLSVGTAVFQIKSIWLKCLRDMAIIWPALAVIGVPLSSGEIAKGGLKLLLKKSESVLPYAEMISMLIIISSITTALIMVRFLWLVTQLRKNNERSPIIVAGQIVPWLGLVLLLFSLPFLINIQSFTPLNATKILLKTNFKNIWPLGVAVILLVGALFFRMSNPFNMKQGDILWFYLGVLNNFSRLVLWIKSSLERKKENFSAGLISLQTNITKPSKQIDSIVDFFSSWKTFGVLFFGLCITLLMILSS